MSASDHLGIQFSSMQMDDLTTNHYARQGRLEVGHAQTIHVPGYPVELSHIRVEDNYQGRGIGHGLMEQAIGHHPGQTMKLTADPFGNYAMNKDQLETFYGSHGFKPTKDKLGMIRKAKR